VIYSAAVIGPISRRRLAEFIEWSSNWPRYARSVGAKGVDSYTGDALDSGYILDRGGLLELDGSLVERKEDPAAVVRLLNSIYFDELITHSLDVNWGKGVEGLLRN